MVVYNKDAKVTPCEPGVERKVLVYSDELMMCEITFQKGAKGMEHSHKHLQITYVAKGVFEFTIDNESKRVSQGDSIYIPSNAVHGVLCIEDGILVDVFNPKRDDFINK